MRNVARCEDVVATRGTQGASLPKDPHPLPDLELILSCDSTVVKNQESKNEDFDVGKVG